MLTSDRRPAARQGLRAVIRSVSLPLILRWECAAAASTPSPSERSVMNSISMHTRIPECISVSVCGGNGKLIIQSAFESAWVFWFLRSSVGTEWAWLTCLRNTWICDPLISTYKRKWVGNLSVKRIQCTFQYLTRNFSFPTVCLHPL